MSDFGRQHGGGRRTTFRSPLAEQGVVTTRSCCSPATILDVSRTGAKLRGVREVQEDEELMLKLGGYNFFGVVRWVTKDLCGVEFDEPMSKAVHNELRGKAWEGYLWRGTVERRLAREDWNTSLIR